MSAQDKFFQFPLCCLAYGDGNNTRQRLTELMAYCIVDAGIPTASALSMEDLMDAQRHPDYDDGLSYEAVAANIGGKALKVDCENLEATAAGYQRVHAFVRSFEREHGEDAQVRIREDYFWDAKEGRMDYREFAVLCAVYSSIGTKPYPVAIPSEMIAARMLGYRSPEIMRRVLKRKKRPEALSKKRLRTTIDKLHQVGCFRAVTLRRRIRYFSHRMTHEQMRAHLLRSRTYGVEFRAVQMRENNELNAKIKARREAVTDPEEVDALSGQVIPGLKPSENGQLRATAGDSGPQADDTKATQRRQDGRLEGDSRAPLIETLVIEPLSIEPPSIQPPLIKSPSMMGAASPPPALSDSDSEEPPLDAQRRAWKARHPIVPPPWAGEELTEEETALFAPFWADYAKRLDLPETAPLHGCPSVHGKFRLHCQQQLGVTPEAVVS